MKTESFNLLRSFIKKQLKVQNLTYKKLAVRMNVSEITVKRWLNNRDFSISTLVEIAKILDFDIFNSIQSNYYAHIQHQPYTLKQEEFLAKEPKAGLILLKLIYNYDLEDIRSILKISKSQLLSYLRKLDNMNFLQLLPGEKIRFLMSGPFRARENGVYINKYAPKVRDSIFQQFKNRKSIFKEKVDQKSFEIFRPFEMYMSKETAKNFSIELMQLLAKYRQLTVLEAKSKKNMQPISGFIGVIEHDVWADVYLNTV